MTTTGLVKYVAAFLVLASTALLGQQPVRASMIDVLANPEKYDGKTISVKGFLRLEFEGDALYFHREDFEQSLTDDAVWMDVGNLSPEKIKGVSDRYVIVVGKFDAGKHGHMGLFRG